jgi:hypothetical protein
MSKRTRIDPRTNRDLYFAVLWCAREEGCGCIPGPGMRVTRETRRRIEVALTYRRGCKLRDAR